jgi:hypothetical protein
MLGIPLAHAAVTASFMASASTPLQPSAMILRAPRPLAVDDGVEPLKTWRQALAKRRAEALQTAPALPAAQERAIVPSSSGTQADKALTWRQALAAKRTEALRSSGLAALPSAQPSAMVPVSALPPKPDTSWRRSFSGVSVEKQYTVATQVSSPDASPHREVATALQSADAKPAGSEFVGVVKPTGADAPALAAETLARELAPILAATDEALFMSTLTSSAVSAKAIVREAKDGSGGAATVEKAVARAMTHFEACMRGAEQIARSQSDRAPNAASAAPTEAAMAARGTWVPVAASGGEPVEIWYGAGI